MMKKALLTASLTGIMLLVTVCCASADTLHYVVSAGQLGSASFNLSRNPTVTSFSAGNDFIVSVNNGSLNLLGFNFSAPPFSLEFSNTSAGGGFGLVVPILGDLQLKGGLMFNGSDSAPTLYTGTFLLDNGLVKVTVTSAPEPSTLLLLSSALVGLGFFRKRLASN
jgi:hypothetical protein